jgi:hypothetical protein
MPQRALNDYGDCSSKNNNEDIFTWQVTGASEKLLLLIQIGYAVGGEGYISGKHPTTTYFCDETNS